MPNNITNEINFKGDPTRIKQILKAIAYDAGEENIPEVCNSIDFRKVIPPPDNLYQGPVGTRERELYGKNNWHDWQSTNWGTKWNTYGYFEKNATEYGIHFKTANGAPHPVVKALSKKYPDVAIEHQWADEDLGYHCGKRMYLGGESIYEYIPDNQKEAVDFGCHLIGVHVEDTGYLENATGTKYIHEESEDFDVVSVFGKPGLYSRQKLYLDEIPKGLFLYYLRDSADKSDFISIDRIEHDDLGGSLITAEALDFGETDSIPLTEPGQVQFYGGELNFGDFINGEFDNIMEEGISLC